MDRRLRRYWIEFSPGVMTSGLGYGVTAIDLPDALALIGRYEWGIRAERPVPSPTRVVEDVDVSSLDPGHVLPNLKVPPVWRGVWFPSGSEPFATR